MVALHHKSKSQDHGTLHLTHQTLRRTYGISMQAD
eukprot:CAMPEP_0169147722 /NCGR_PEP_ID=MMETSP1015-20121227/48408_1 /TAXON_ID=342587 /ORGANISM="Karlodinium micrum, Strain CCMP2283" /LENGTH=34 /DNA_ID= /DNA_START= /DNA_END= /DNA_ORIENTATION=